MPQWTIAQAIMAATAVTTVATVGTTAYQTSEERKGQKKILSAQEASVAAAEAKAKGAEALATEEAKAKLKKQRLAQTRTILTSPLGIPGEANIGMKTLLGG